jgi:hypothetical protein
VYAAERRYADPRNTPHLGGKGTKVPARNGIYADPPNNKLGLFAAPPHGQHSRLAKTPEGTLD